MWLAILILAPIAIVVHGHYFSARLVRAWESVFSFGAKIARRVRIGYLVLTYLVPILLVGWIAYVLLARPDRGGSPDIWAFDVFVLLPFWFSVAYAVQCTILIAPVDAVFWVLDKIGKRPSATASRRRHVFALVVAAALLIYMPIRIAIEASSLDVRTYDVGSPDLPAELDGFTIALLADPQADVFTTRARLAQYVRAANRHEPDVVLIAGDIITRSIAYLDGAAEELAELEARHGVISAIGDHENFAFRDRERSVRTITEALEAVDIAMVDNQVALIDVGGRQLAVIVATHNYITPIDPATARDVVGRADGADFKVLLAHQTGDALIGAARDAGVDLYLSGHTHGGQVRLWWLGLDLVPARVETRYITGRYSGDDLGDMELIVSSGLGMSVLPFRYRAPATVDIITLRRYTP